jgi:glycosyltransferase involved in cell wall biosynthesis
MLELAQEVDADIYHLHDPELLLLANRLKKKGKIVIFDSHENVGEQILFKKYLPVLLRRIISNAYKRFEKNVVKCIDGVIYVTPVQKENFLSIQKNSLMVTNFPLLINFADENVLRYSSIGTKNIKKICFAGGISDQWSHEIIIKSVLQIEDVMYSFAGPIQPKYLQPYLQGNFDRIEYLGQLNQKGVADLYLSSFCGIALLSYDTQVGHEGTLGNTKLFEYMKYRLPIICSDLMLWKEIIDTYKCGIAVNPTDTDEIIHAIKFLKENPAIAIQMGNNGFKAYKEVFNWDTQIPNLLEVYTNAI